MAEVKRFNDWSDTRASEALALMKIARAAGAEAVRPIPRNDKLGMGNGERQAALRVALKALRPMLEDHGLVGLVEPLGFAQTARVNRNPNPKAIFGDWAMDLPVVVPVLVGLGCGLLAGIVNGALIACIRIPPFIATLGLMVFARGMSRWWSNGNPVSFPTESYAAIGKGMTPVVIFVSLAVLFHLILTQTRYGKHCYAIGSNEQASRMSGDQGREPQDTGLCHRRHAGRPCRLRAVVQEPDGAGGHGRDVRT